VNALADIGAWIAENEATLSGLAAIIVVAGVVFTPVGSVLRRFLAAPAAASARPAPTSRSGAAASPDSDGRESGPPSIAVLPLDVLSSESRHAFLADGLSEDLTTALAANRHLQVAARNSTFQYKGQSPDVRKAGRELGVRYVLEGSIRPVGGIARVTVQLIAVRDGTHLFAERYDMPLEGDASEQDALVADIAGALSIQILHAERLRCRMLPEDVADAWDLLMAAMGFITYGSPTRDRMNAAIARLEKAVEFDPENATINAFHAWLLRMRAINGWTPTPGDDFRAARTAFDKATRGYAGDPLTQTFIGAACIYAGSHDRAVRVLESSLEINPHQPDALTHLALAHGYLGDYEKAYHYYDLADRVVTSDLGGPFRWYRAQTLVLEQRYAEAISILKHVLDTYPTYSAVRIVLALAYEGIGDGARARAEIERTHAMEPDLHIPGVELILAAHPDPEQGAARVDMLRRYWPATASLSRAAAP
jgi:TolB-like protein